MSDLITPIVDGKAVKNQVDTSEKKEVAGGELGKDAFLQLLVAQMQYQDPLEPTSNTEYISQLATYSQVEELQNMGTSMDKLQSMTLVGSTVDIKNELTNGTTKIITGVVDFVNVKDKKVSISVNGNLYDASKVLNVYNASYKAESDKTTTDKTETDKTDTKK